MRPIDTIRKSIDSDLMKYHSMYVCKIDSRRDIKILRGTGMCAMVTPIEEYDYDNAESSKDTIDMEKKFPVFIINRPQGYVERNIHLQYFVLVINPVNDRGVMSIGFLIPKEGVRASGEWGQKMVDQNGESIEERQEENLVRGI